MKTKPKLRSRYHLPYMIGIYVTPEDHERFKRLAAEAGLGAAAYGRVLLRHGMHCPRLQTLYKEIKP